MRPQFRRNAGIPFFFFLIAAPLLGPPLVTCGQDPLVIGPLRVLSGQSASGFLEVPAREGVGTSIPVTVIHGAKEGKTLGLVAGVHGYEYPPVLALYRLKDMIDPQELAGTLILVHIANLPSFQKRTIYYNPHDWKNLNRVFPGDPEGTLSQRTAYVLTEEVVKKCDCLIDLHCGDGNEALIPYSYWMISGRREMDEITRTMALAFGIPHIIIDETRSKDLSDSKYLGNTAVLLGKPAITTESGYLGRTDEESIRRNVDGILSVMRLFRMIEGPPGKTAEPVWIDRYEVVNSRTDGLFYAWTKMGYYVVKGQKVGQVTDFLGNIKEEVRAPFSGIVLYIINTPPTSKGEPLFEVGRVKEEK
ncbi:MAG TPA: M14 family metallopeptidase [Candidatus Desulfaltia sp.]|nr:M14 family metallopeptidase [Candidatus Desulfaltia sp.]